MAEDGVPRELRSYVENHREELAYVLKHGEDETVRGLALAVLLRGGDERDREEVKREIDSLEGKLDL
ncbi:hypothetical protein C474_18570 [Halogeometricum pallidum JCM 14848]|uniref:HEAT repeat domain-containing protein n=1 Tax=Halogeometricum pallidum JCM 14848 TaxID=1227487 RepID=M0CVL6_HALPD|nr:hypothetical protein [Halogeometricum pallidum]ELZ26673.1 hypothetical protein C474_18570 [Halogeometricum pallidum JCM 14848]